MEKLKMLSALLLRVHGAAHARCLDDFQDAAMDLLNGAIPFDGAWWGMSAWDGAQFHLHSSYHRNLPEDFDEIWETHKHEDALALATEREPGVAVVFDEDKLRLLGGMRDVALRFGVSQAMAVAHLSPTTNLFAFLSLYRLRGRPSFTEEERQLIEGAMPHFTMALNINRITGLGQLRASNGKSRFAMGIADRKGILHNAEPGFVEHILSNWPGWSGPVLPDPLVQAIRRQAFEYVGQHLSADISAVGDLFLLTLKRRSNVERLSKRELEIADAFATGESYKEIARALSLAPATVRHHLRTVYVKLGVSNKAALVQALHTART